MNKNKKFGLAASVIIGLLALSGCYMSSDSKVASKNIATAASEFEIDRRVVFLNGITDKYLLEIRGRCSVNNDGRSLAVTCQTGPDSYKKHILGLSDNVSYFVEQLDNANVSAYHYRVIFKPESIIPAFELDIKK